MKVCAEHWAMFRKTIDDRGMTGLIDKDAKTAFDRTVSELSGEPQGDDLDPLMSMNWHWCGLALQAGGLYLMVQDETGANDGHFCPICEFVKHAPDFDAARDIGRIADQMQTHARETGMIPAVS